MSPRLYRQTQRALAADDTRRRILRAALDRLLSGERFTIDGVATSAGVTRATVYAHFAGGAAEMRDAVYDDLAEAGGLTRLPIAFASQDPREGLRTLVEIFCSFYAAHRAVLRRLNALANLGREDGAHGNRNERRRTALSVLMSRIADAGGPPVDVDSTVTTLLALTSFAFFDQLANDVPGVDAITSRIWALVCATVDAATAQASEVAQKAGLSKR
ncbi:MAG: TetR/AcrR family transcriptional regulator [Candidatus Dormibacteraeota bacterium]|nr:TetR/AcrR family transcriptional regulator [Candidatus Dormibacteraeota bacterium]